MCITPDEFSQRKGDFDQYCPVSLALRGELVDCSTNVTLEFAVEFRGMDHKDSVRIRSEFNKQKFGILSLAVCIDPFPNKPLLLHVCSTSLLKILREKEKLLVTRK